MQSRPTMKPQSAHQLPAIEWYMPAKGPTAWARNPSVGEPPWIQASADAVSLCRPKVLSRKGQRKVQPRQMRTTAHR